MAADLAISTEEDPPLNMTEDGQIDGISTDILKKAMDLAGITYSIEVLPWRRAYDNALKHPDACVYSTNRTAVRENQFKWVGPIISDSWVIYQAADNGIRPRSIDDLKPYRIGTYLGDSESVDLKSRGFTVDEAQTDDLNPKKLQLGRIDFWATSQIRASYITEKQKLFTLRPVLTWGKATIFMACNNAVPDSLVNRINDGLKKVADQKINIDILKTYLLRPMP